MQFHYSKDTGLSLEKALSIEWLETNSLGGYSSSTIINCNTRKYHGLLVSKLDYLPDKYVLLNKIEDLFIQNNQEYFLTAHIYPNFLQNGGFVNLQEFQYTSHPIWSFKFSDTILTKEILMLHEENTVLFKYIVNNGKDCKISLRPLLACRSFHSLQHENSYLTQDIEKIADGFSCMPYKELPKIFFQANAKINFLPQPLWYRNFIYVKEKERGYDFSEDLFSPGVIIFELKDTQENIFSCSTIRQKNNLSHKWQEELKRRVRSIPVSTNGHEVTSLSGLQEQLHQACQSFITTNIITKKQGIVAGYHWFLEWGRDAMIALPGLTLYSGQAKDTLAILRNFALHEEQGLIPNYFGATKKTNAYNSVDASLWFVWAVQQYYLKTRNLQGVIAYFWNTIKNIFKHYSDGTLYNIKMHSNGLLYAGSQDINLTWIDAVIDGRPVTPRYGYQVEVNALWFNMLNFMAELAESIKDPIAQELQQLLSLIPISFRQIFWCEEKKYLYDFVNDQEKNSLLRPNQIFAVSLPYPPLLLQAAVSVVTAVKEHLLTPYGLRTLAKYEASYVGHYAGNQMQRDYAYHNGTVWPWLLGAFTESLLKVTYDRCKVLAIMAPCLEALQRHLAEYGIGSIAEIFSGDPPHEPDGCISQAWSVAEIFRLTYLLNISK